MKFSMPAASIGTKSSQFLRLSSDTKLRPGRIWIGQLTVWAIGVLYRVKLLGIWGHIQRLLPVLKVFWVPRIWLPAWITSWRGDPGGTPSKSPNQMKTGLQSMAASTSIRIHTTKKNTISFKVYYLYMMSLKKLGVSRLFLAVTKNRSKITCVKNLQIKIWRNAWHPT